MNKNIYVDLADKLDSAGLFQESDDLMKVFSSSTSMIKTAQSNELLQALTGVDKLSGYTHILEKSGLVGALPLGLVNAIRTWKMRSKEIDYEFQEQKVVADVPDTYRKKTIDPEIVSEVKAQNDKYKRLPANQKTLVEIYVPNNTTRFSVEDPSSYRIDKYYLPDNIDKTIEGVTKPTENTLIKKLFDPNSYIKDLMNDGKVETIKVPKNKTVSITPSSKETDKNKAKRRAAWKAAGKGLIAAIIGASTVGASLFAEINIEKRYLPKNITNEYRRYKNKYDNQNKSKETSAIILEEFSTKLDSLLSNFDGKSTLVPNSLDSKEDFKNKILKVFKKEIGFGVNPNTTSVSGSNAEPSQKPTTQAKPRSGPRTPPTRPSAPSGGSTGGGGSAAPAGL
jgi:galactitol-specific phosphotransferase system IIB component